MTYISQASKKLATAIIGGLLLFTMSNASATLIDMGAYSTDDETGLDWRISSAPLGLDPGYDALASFINSGGYSGWRMASANEMTTLFDSVGGNGVYDGWSTDNNGVLTPILQNFGTTRDYSIPYEGYQRVETLAWIDGGDIAGMMRWGHPDYIGQLAVVDGTGAGFGVPHDPIDRIWMVRGGDEISTVPEPSSLMLLSTSLLLLWPRKKLQKNTSA